MVWGAFLLVFGVSLGVFSGVSLVVFGLFDASSNVLVHIECLLHGGIIVDEDASGFLLIV